MCDCVDKINRALGPEGEIRPTILIRGNALVARMCVPIYRNDTGKPETRRGKPSTMMATYCPFCGVRYEPEPVLTTEGGADAAA
jgi:hypothetical protein